MQPIARSALKEIALAMCVSLTSSAQSDEPIRIGLLTDLSGPAAQFGRQAAAGAELAVREINADGGRKVQIFVEDHSLDTKRAVSAAQKLLLIDHVDGGFSNFSSTSTAASSAFYSAKKPFVYSAAAVSILRTNPYAFKSFLDFATGCGKVAERWREQGIARVAHLKPLNEAGERCASGAKQIYPQMREYEFTVGENVRSQVSAIKRDENEAVLTSSYDSDMHNLLQALDEQQFAPKIGAVEVSFNEKVCRKYPEALARTTLFGLPRVDKEFEGRVLAIGQTDDPTSMDHAAISYLHVRQLYAAIRSCGRNDIDCVVQEISEAAPESLLQFQGFRDREAVFPTVIIGGGATTSSPLPSAH